MPMPTVYFAIKSCAICCNLNSKQHQIDGEEINLDTVQALNIFLVYNPYLILYV